MVGTTLAHYRIEAQLGAGGMGVVYRAHDTKLGRDVALKLLPDQADASARARLLNEARTASSLNHPHICTIYEVGEAGGQVYIAMELVDGRPLSQLVPSEGMPTETVLRYGEQVADALSRAHDRGILHRDLKTANVVITSDGRAKVLDFGLAKRFSLGGVDDPTRSEVSPQTQAGTISGTLHYLAPEALRGQPADARSDIWSLGVMLYEMAAGAMPFPGGTGFEVSSAILREPPTPLPERVPAGLRAIIQRCLAKEPTQRYQRAGEVGAALEAIRSDTAVMAAVSQVAAAPAVKAPRSKWASIAYIALAVLLVVVIFQLGRARRESPPAPPPATAPPAQRLSTGGKPSSNAEANAYYEKAFLFLNARFDLPGGRHMLEKALELDPKFADARAHYALTHLLHIEAGVSNERAWVYKADEEVRRALQDDPESVFAHSIAAAVNVYQGRLDLANSEAQRALQITPDHTAAMHWQTIIYHLRGDYPAAISLARQQLQIMPTFFPAQWLLGVLLYETGDTPGGVHALAGVLDQDPQNHYALRQLALIHISGGDTKAARAFLERMRPSDRQNFRIRLTWAALLAREGKRREALREMDAEVQKYAEVSPRVTLTAAEIYVMLDDKQQAIEWLDRAVRNGDERTEWFQRDPLLAGIRDLPRFKQILDSIANRRGQGSPGSGLATPIAPRLSTGGRPSTNAEANEYYEKGVMFLGTRIDLPRARAMLEKALQIDPHFAEARAEYGFSHFLLIDSGISNDNSWLYKAEEELRQALRDDPNVGRAHSALAAVYFYQGRKELVLGELEKARKANPDDLDVPNWTLNYYAFNGDYAAAQALAEQTLKRAPLFFPARMNLGDILRQQGDWNGAIRAFEKILEQDPENSYAILKLARTYLDAANLPMSRKTLERGRPADRKNYESQLHWALLLMLEGKRSEARKEANEEALKYAAVAPWSTTLAAEYYALGGETSKALEWLDRAVRNGDDRIEWFKRDPLLANIRNEPRFKQILDSIAHRRAQRPKS